MAFGLVLVTGVFAPEFVFAQSKQDAQLIVRVQELEDTVRTLTGQVEGLQFQLTQMQQLIQKMQEDDEFRFQQLEGGAGKKPEAATHSGGATPTGTSPQAKSSATTETTSPPKSADLAAPPPLKPSGDTAPMASAGPAPSADVGGQPNDGLGDSQDPLLGKGGHSGPRVVALGTGEPLDLNLSSTAPPASGDADAQYKAGYDAIIAKDYAFAAEQFRHFIDLYPKDPQAPDATNWLGEALLEQAKTETGDDQARTYTDAADVLFKGYKAYQTSPRARDLLFKLAVALVGAGEQETACGVFAEVAQLYPKQPAAFTQSLQQEKSKANCPA